MGERERYLSNCEYKFRVLFSLPASSWSAGVGVRQLLISVSPIEIRSAFLSA